MVAAPDILRGELRKLLALPDRIAPAAEARADGALRLNDHPVTFLVPESEGPFPAVLYCHAHGGDYALGRHELTEGARWLARPYAGDLPALGIAVLAIDMPGFGARAGEGTEAGLARAGLWRGRPLFGRMVADHMAALRWLQMQPEIDATRIATLGISMGAAHAFWLAALEPGVAAVAHICMLADMAPLIESGTHTRHGDYLTVPGLLRHAEIGDVAALVAPRPQFVGAGAADHLAPQVARDAALARLLAAYGGDGALEILVDPEGGHGETENIREAVLDFLVRVLIAGKEKEE